MSYRYMRVIVMFDLPTITVNDGREYRRFRKFLIKSGFIMMQESVYSKLVLNANAAEAIISNVKKNKPPAGIIQLLTVTEKQFSNIELVVGTIYKDVIDSTERLVVI